MFGEGKVYYGSTPDTPEEKAVDYGIHLVLTDPDAAKALLEELLYWQKQGRLT